MLMKEDRSSMNLPTLMKTVQTKANKRMITLAKLPTQPNSKFLDKDFKRTIPTFSHQRKNRLNEEVRIVIDRAMIRMANITTFGFFASAPVLPKMNFQERTETTTFAQNKSHIKQEGYSSVNSYCCSSITLRQQKKDRMLPMKYRTAKALQMSPLRPHNSFSAFHLSFIEIAFPFYPLIAFCRQSYRTYEDRIMIIIENSPIPPPSSF